jgi:hypothetical protein
MKKSLRNYFLLLCLSSTSGCATLFGGSSQTISLKAVDTSGNMLDGVKCVFQDSYGDKYNVNSNPGSATIPRGKDALSAVCTKPGYKQLNTAVGQDFNKTTLLNVLFWPGALVDGMTGAYKKYPSHYLVTMEQIMR